MQRLSCEKWSPWCVTGWLTTVHFWRLSGIGGSTGCSIYSIIVQAIVRTNLCYHTCQLSRQLCSWLRYLEQGRSMILCCWRHRYGVAISVRAAIGWTPAPGVGMIWCQDSTWGDAVTEHGSMQLKLSEIQDDYTVVMIWYAGASQQAEDCWWQCVCITVHSRRMHFLYLEACEARTRGHGKPHVTCSVSKWEANWRWPTDGHKDFMQNICHLEILMRMSREWRRQNCRQAPAQRLPAQRLPESGQGHVCC